MSPVNQAIYGENQAPHCKTPAYHKGKMYKDSLSLCMQVASKVPTKKKHLFSANC